ncbi:hypothetical protein BASA50_011241 [Batrachochytrium salamandrivorans]|uniref:Extracellular metalloproteinase n=1 Tax=Batrachochytrium salamandrivorans TaxID=1357716 RepID=A0ABQ8EWN2_9FUNG|nr:hypothetical protein BASA50_011241 [Batrachochytrium salamandrivorans]
MFDPALTLVLALVLPTVIAVPIVNNVYKRAAASLDSSSAELPFHFPESVYESIPHSGAASSPSSEEDDVKAATDFISNRLSLGESDFKVFDSYTDSFGIGHVYGAHMINGARIANHQAAAHVKNGEVAFFSSSFGTDQHLAKRDLIISEPKATVDFAKASAIASAQLKIPVYSEFEHTLEYVAQSDGKVVYAYTFQLRDNPLTKWVQVWCDTTTGKVIQTVNFANKATYKIIPIPRRDPSEGFAIVFDPEVIDSSPNGWTDGKATEGNNVITSNPTGRITRSIRNGVFHTRFDSTKPPGTVENTATTAVNLFYITNVMHDISYQYGFTESAGNFQKDNFGKGGEGNDAVAVNVFYPSAGTNNATFFTPPDGQPGEMNMYRFTKTTPNRSGGLDNSVVIHEYAHGITNRLTGGPATSGCLNTNEAWGLDEGWSDIMAMMVLAKKSDTATTRISIGAYSINNPAGFRFQPYTTDMRVNFLTYGSLETRRNRAHRIGEVWATMLWDIYWNLVTKHGFSKNLYDASQSEGNIVAMKIIIGGMTLQSCNPTFLGARDAIIAADKLHYNGAHKCEIYKGFGNRGLGLGATRIRIDDFSIPPECERR